jgi:YD repeat-containing protein
MRSYRYGGVSYANPDAPTQIATGLSTTTYAYDNNGNLTSSGNGTATTTYSYDYANRLIALFWRCNNFIRIRCFRIARVSDRSDDIDQHISVQILLSRVDDEIVN